MSLTSDELNALKLGDLILHGGAPKLLPWGVRRLCEVVAITPQRRKFTLKSCDSVADTFDVPAPKDLYNSVLVTPATLAAQNLAWRKMNACQQAIRSTDFITHSTAVWSNTLPLLANLSPEDCEKAAKLLADYVALVKPGLPDK